MTRKDPFNWRDKPSVVGRTIPILKVDHSIAYRYVVCGDRLWARDVHWNVTARRSEYCTMDPTTCPRCKDEMPKREVTFLHVSLVNFPTSDGFLELTPEGANNFFNALREGEPMRGLQILVQRARKTLKSPILVECVNRVEEMTPFPVSADPTTTLMRLWRVMN